MLFNWPMREDNAEGEGDRFYLVMSWSFKIHPKAIKFRLTQTDG